MKKNTKKVTAKNFGKLSLAAHRKTGGKVELVSKFPLKNRDDLSTAYTPGVGAVCMEIVSNKSLAKTLTLKKNTIAVLSDGSAVLGFGNIGPEAAIPVMEGKAVLMKHFAGVDAFPICLATQDTEEIISIVKNLAPVFGGVNLEDISAPRCFEIEERLKKELGLPVMHDDQWGAATVALAGFVNALKIVKKKKESVSVCVVGAGAAGIATVRLLAAYGVQDIVTFDTDGAIYKNRKTKDGKSLKDSNKYKFEISKYNTSNTKGTLEDNIDKFDVFFGLSKPGTLTSEMVSKMKKNPIVFAMANPVPEIMPDLARQAGAAVVGTGRSDFPNQLNNSVFFPGFWKGILSASQKVDTSKYDASLFVQVAKDMADYVKNVDSENILPSTLDKGIHKLVASAVEKYFINK